MSAYLLIFYGALAAGSATWGAVAARAGTRAALAAAALGSLALGLLARAASGCARATLPISRPPGTGRRPISPSSPSRSAGRCW